MLITQGHQSGRTGDLFSQTHEYAHKLAKNDGLRIDAIGGNNTLARDQA